ncbi:MAG: sulfurtransferase TusA family protein [Pseudomonadota bacterium]
MSNQPHHDGDLDARGLLCPLPVLKARKRLGSLQVGQVLRVAADDPAARVDVPHFCTEQGHDLLAMHEGEGGVLTFWLRRGQ